MKETLVFRVEENNFELVARYNGDQEVTATADLKDNLRDRGVIGRYLICHSLREVASEKTYDVKVTEKAL